MSHLICVPQCPVFKQVVTGWQGLSSEAYVAQTLLGMIIRKMRKGLLPMRDFQG